MTPNAPSFCMPILGGSDDPSEPVRQRLLLAALELFAEQGYAKTSIRRITLAAGANIAAVSYYFGNKEGLYRAVFWGGREPDRDGPALPHDGPDFLAGLYDAILAPLRNGEQARWWIRLHRREMLEPAGLWKDKVDRGMQPMHGALVAWLCGQLDVAEPDDEVLALATLVIGMAVHILVNCEVVEMLSPQLLQGPAAVDHWRERLLRASGAMVEAERQRRRSAAAPSVRTRAPKRSRA